MRIKEEILKLIKELAIKYFGKDCEVAIFGSRIDNTKRGGDIDIYIETSIAPEIIEAKARFLANLEIALGDQKIDLVVKKRNESRKEPIYKYAKSTGVRI
ncbi:MAG: nucleotidyltransferase domain-containing protein [bacterium]